MFPKQIYFPLLIFLFFFSGSYLKAEEIQFYSTPTESNVSSIQNAIKFKAWEKCDLPFFQLNTNTHFTKFELPKSSESRIMVIENPVLDTLDIYIYSHNLDSLIVYYKSGKTVKFSQDAYSKYVLPNFLIPATSKDLMIYIKSQSNSQTSVPIKVMRIDGFVESASNANSIAGVYFGILIVMLLYNLFIWASVRDKTYLHYCFYILALILTQLVLQGYAKKFIGPNSELFNLHSIVFSGSLLGIATIIFARSFLKSRHFLPKLDKGLILIIPLCFISLAMDSLGYYSMAFNIINLIIGIGSLYLFLVSIIVYNKGYRPALFFVIAFAIFLVGTIFFVLKDYGHIPYNNFSIYVYQFGSVIQVILLSLALANSINILKKEKEKEQQGKLEALEENKRIILNQKDILEVTVKEKTKELVEANKEINLAMDNLKNTQVSLVESEKMASLGQLTAGVAHEINNPINFVSSNVKPLIRDFDDINSFISNLLEKSQEGDSIPSELVTRLHKDLDIAYTQKEIRDLLTGIQEGANRTAEIVRGLKNFSRLDEADFKTADIEDGLDSTLILLRSNLKGEIELLKDYGNITPIDCYAGKLNQVFMNLINNSIYAIANDKSKPQGTVGKIVIKTEETPDSIMISFEDNGMGMDEETKNKVFNPFFTTKPVGEGTGLGMSITYNIIMDMHEGSISVESELGKGTKIALALPKALKK